MKKIACFALFASAMGCGSSGGGTPDATPPAIDTAPVEPPDTKIVQACDHAAALCTKLAECAPFLLAAGYGDVAGCTERLIAVCDQQSKSTGSGMNLTTILACEAALASASCDQVYTNQVAACVFHGSVPDGAVCGDHAQCASGFCSHTDANSMCGVCIAKGAAGAACPSGNNDECQAGLVCSSGKVCVTPAKQGGACDDATAPCPVGWFCTSAKTCAQTVAVGEPCPGAYLNLANGTVCWGKDSASNPQVAAQFGTAGPGEPCGLAPPEGRPPTLCAPGSVAACAALPNSINLLGMPTNGVCLAQVAPGNPCTPTSTCATGSICMKGVCTIPSGRYCGQTIDGGS